MLCKQNRGLQPRQRDAAQTDNKAMRRALPCLLALYHTRARKDKQTMEEQNRQQHPAASEQQQTAAKWNGNADLNNPLDISTEDFIKAFGYESNDAIFCRVFDDTPAKDQSKARTKSTRLAAIDGLLKELHRCNSESLGVFFVVNGGGQTDAETKAKGKARAQFMEIDDRPLADQLELIKQFPAEPSIIVKTRKSLHTYWLLDNGNIKQFRELQQRLALYFHGDNANINESRTMRLPGFNHCKVEPVPVVVIKYDPGIKYTQQELASLLPELPKRYPSEPLPEVLTDAPGLYMQGSRNNDLLKLGGHLRAAGCNAEQISLLLRTLDAESGNPLPERELNTCIKQSLAYNRQELAEQMQQNQAKQELAKEEKADTIADFLQTIQTDAYKPYSTELAFFDNLLHGGVIRQSLVQIIAAPGAGKTTLCQQIAEAMARHCKQVLYLNLEMSKEQMLAKALSCRLGKNDNSDTISATDILQGYKWDTKQRERITAEFERYKHDTAPFIRYTNANNDLDSINALLQEMGEKAAKEEQPAPVVFVDYLHLITGAKYGDTQELLKAAVGCFKQYAVKYNSIVFLIIAANRESNKSGQYTLESGRDSSAIEYSGDYVLSLNYTEIDNGNIKPTDEAELAKVKSAPWRNMTLRVLKHRLGVPGLSAQLWYKPAANIFYDSTDFLPVDPERDKIADEALQRTLAKRNPGKDQSDKQTKAGGLFANGKG